MTQLDPVDTILYTAMLYESADLIESKRVAKDLRVACSYRVTMDSHGRFFAGEDTGWTDFTAHSEELANDWEHSYVALADISDLFANIRGCQPRCIIIALQVSVQVPQRIRKIHCAGRPFELHYAWL